MQNNTPARPKEFFSPLSCYFYLVKILLNIHMTLWVFGSGQLWPKPASKIAGHGVCDIPVVDSGLARLTSLFMA